MVSYEEIVDAFQQVLQIETKRMGVIIQNLNQEKATATFYTDTIKYLSVLTFDHVYKRITIKGKTTKIYEIDEGSFGKIYQSEDSSFVIKELSIQEEDPQKLEFLVREVFLELFIQTVLSKDAEYGKHVCGPYALYRSEQSHRTDRPFCLYIKMEFIPRTLYEHLYLSSIPLSMERFAPTLISLSEILDHFQKTYNFKHRDLHSLNVMVSNGEVKLIDFGLSQMDIEGITYSLQTNPTRPQPEDGTPLNDIFVKSKPESYDMLVFLSSFLERYAKKLYRQEDEDFINMLLTTKKGTNVFRYWKEHNTQDFVYHNMYDWDTSSWPEELKAELEESKELFSPAHIAKITRINFPSAK